ncbi:hypothetical protein [Halarchaeum nitratireducens]|uniref:Uncharacterized protein n=1 Tax=Halarchaeum nitratireducens TaxID=489913 RepID=A0A830GC55_9EURY|nr:hypothetical protein [Halarchaeum nitratireducens]GGN18618.1 hypothetical protein GCM10009021_19520 [Halarchaeum nitratireducens]
MATATGGYADLNGKQNIILDVIALMGIPWFAAILFGVMTSALSIFGGLDFTAPIWTIMGADISIAFLVVLGGLAWILATNEIDGAAYEDWQWAIIVFALASPVLYVLVPSFKNLVMINGISQLLWTMAVSAAATYISYSN